MNAEERQALAPIRVERDRCIDFDRSSHLEWLETNGTGGFAMGTVSGANTRRYHGLLIASLHPPVERFLILSKLDETAAIEGVDVALGTNQYPGALHPTGFRHLVEFRLDPFPIWTFDVGGARLQKKIFLVHGEQTVVVQYRCTRPCRLRVHPFLAFRDYHSLGKSNSSFDTSVREDERRGIRTLSIRPYPGMPELHLRYVDARIPFERNGAWHYNTEYLEELNRGLDFREDLYRMGTIHLQLSPEESAWIVASFEDDRGFDGVTVERLERSERSRRRATSSDATIGRLSAAADQFIVTRADGKPTVIAGYPWFTDWGRDTMLALPGLLLARGLLDQGRQVIRGFLQHLDQGLIPNRFPDRGERPEYNTADATLWMFQAANAYLQASRDANFLREEFYPAAKSILTWHRRGTHHGIRVDESDGLLIAGGEGTQLTWMDAKVDGRVITPRHGKPVEVNALYYNALKLMEQWANSLNEREDAAAYGRDSAVVKRSFEAGFWNEERKCLYDVLTPTGPDSKLRPNQLFAVSLSFPLLAPAKRVAVVRAAEAALLTPLGLRTLAPEDPGYLPHYRGGVVERDSAYHQGAVWPWLLGPFIRAYLRAFGNSAANVAHCRSLLRGLEDHLADACLGTISEIFEAEPPYRPVGAPAQAWSVAEMLHLLRVDLATAQHTAELPLSRSGAKTSELSSGAAR
ncbi:MAG TPA: amylo-alpha-1,6-glucosidase [Myxococcaceae bacterium]|nr:amylo-alpha-1,6-glucosidase [Myxococcaceae bacterium]